MRARPRLADLKFGAEEAERDELQDEGYVERPGATSWDLTTLYQNAWGTVRQRLFSTTEAYMRHRDELTTLIQERVRQYEAGDLDAVLSPTAEAEASELMTQLPRTVTAVDAESATALAWFHWYHGTELARFAVIRVSAALFRQIRAAAPDMRLPPGMAAILEAQDVAGRLDPESATALAQEALRGDVDAIGESILVLSEAEALAWDAGAPADLAVYMFLHGQQLTVLYSLSGLADSLDTAVKSLSDALRLASLHAPGIVPAGHGELGTALLLRFQMRGWQPDLDRALGELRLAHELLAPRNPQWLRSTLNLGSVLLLSGDHLGAENVLSSALSRYPGDVLGTAQLRLERGRTRCLRYRSGYRLPDLDAGMDDLRVAYGVQSSQPEAAQVRDDAATLLSRALFDRYDLDHELGHLDEAARLLNERLDRARGGARVDALRALSAMNLLRFRQVKDFDALADAIDTADEVLRLAEPDDEPALAACSILAEALSERYRARSDLADLNRAIDIASDGERRSHRENRILCLKALGAALTDRALAVGSRADANRSVEVLTRAVGLTPAEASERGRVRSALGNALATRARLFGDARDADDAITEYHKAIEGTRDHHTLEGLAAALISRALLGSGGLEDLDEAIALCQEAIRIAPEGSKYHARSLLATARARRAVRTESREDRDAAIETGTEALRDMPAWHPERRVCLSNLASAYSMRYRGQRNVLPDLNQAIDLLREALDITPPGNGHRPGLLANLASTLTDRFEVTSQASDFDTAVRYATKAIDECPADRVERAQLHYLRARAFLGTAKLRADSGSSQHLESAVQDLCAAADHPLAPPAVRVAALTKLAELATAPDAALTYYEEIVSLTPLLVSPKLSRSEREGLLVELKGVFREATAAALDCGQQERAVEILEYGRSIDWSQTARPDLTPSPVAYSSLITVAPEGAVVLINIAQRRSDALALTPDGLQVIRLTSATPAEVETQVIHYIDGLANMETGGAERIFGEQQAAEMRTSMGLVSRGESLKMASLIAKGPLEWLWNAIADPVLTALGHIDTPADASGASWPRVWWCPTGLLAHLPLHAAGRYIRGTVPGECVMDRVVSSYAPSLRALGEARGRTAPPDARRMLVVAMPETPGFRPLPDAAEDIESLSRLFGGEATVIAGTEANCEAVCTALPGHSWAHFTCHGDFVPLDPIHSGLRLHGETLTVADILRLRLANPEFAFLSVCHSASSGHRLPDEAMNVAGALHAAGFRHVVAASWIVTGRYAGLVADQLYLSVNATGSTAPPEFAVALHQALRDLRAQPEMELAIWIPFLHIGP